MLEDSESEREPNLPSIQVPDILLAYASHLVFSKVPTTHCLLDTLTFLLGPGCSCLAQLQSLLACPFPPLMVISFFHSYSSSNKPVSFFLNRTHL